MSGTDVEFRQSSSCASTLGCFCKKSYSKGDIIFTIPQTFLFGIGAVYSLDLDLDLDLSLMQ